MIYPIEFERLISSADIADFIGWGNPNAKILLLGKEPAIDLTTGRGRNQYEIEVKRNRADWSRNIARQTGFNEVTDEFRKSKIYGNPLYPHCWQKYRITNLKDGEYLEGKEGTARTWYKYQKLINMIFGRTSSRNDFLDFHKYCFSTDMSAVAALDSARTNSEETCKSVKERVQFFEQDFFKCFPIIIAAVGHYPKKYAGDGYFKNTFGVKWMQEKSVGIPGAWINVNEIHNSGMHRLLLHTCQASARHKDAYIEAIAAFVREFVKKYDIDLAPVL